MYSEHTTYNCTYLEWADSIYTVLVLRFLKECQKPFLRHLSSKNEIGKNLTTVFLIHLVLVLLFRYYVNLDSCVLSHKHQHWAVNSFNYTQAWTIFTLLIIVTRHKRGMPM